MFVSSSPKAIKIGVDIASAVEDKQPSRTDTGQELASAVDYPTRLMSYANMQVWVPKGPQAIREGYGAGQTNTYRLVGNTR
jgi:hypothetical protein